MTKAKALRWLAWAMGVACVLIGLVHVTLGNASIPGAGSAGTTIDSLGRFFGGIFAGYGAAWIWAARQTPIPAGAVRWLAGVFALGAVGRLLSLAVHGWPHPFQVVLTVMELVLPPLFFWLADAEEAAGTAGAAAENSPLREGAARSGIRSLREPRP